MGGGGGGGGGVMEVFQPQFYLSDAELSSTLDDDLRLWTR